LRPSASIVGGGGGGGKAGGDFLTERKSSFQAQGERGGRDLGEQSTTTEEERKKGLGKFASDITMSGRGESSG